MRSLMPRLMAIPALVLLAAVPAAATTWVKAEIWSTADSALSSGLPRAVAVASAMPYHDGPAIGQCIGGAAVTSRHSFTVGLDADSLEHPVTFDASDSVYTFQLTPGATPTLAMDLVVDGMAAGNVSVSFSSTGGEALLVIPRDSHSGPITAYVVHLTAWRDDGPAGE